MMAQQRKASNTASSTKSQQPQPQFMIDEVASTATQSKLAASRTSMNSGEPAGLAQAFEEEEKILQ